MAGMAGILKIFFGAENNVTPYSDTGPGTTHPEPETAFDFPHP